MYVDVSHVRQGGKTYTRCLLRESYREDGKVKHRTIANLSGCSAAEIEAIRLALRHKDNLSALGTNASEIVIKQGLSYGAVHVVYEVARSLGIVAALGPTRDGRLALWQIIARVIDQGSRLSAVRLAQAHAAKEILGLNGFDEDDLYANLDWLAKQQPDIEKVLFEKQEASEGLFLYDVTSTYLEGKHNAFGAFGYNRDGNAESCRLSLACCVTLPAIRWPSKFFREIPKTPRPSPHRSIRSPSVLAVARSLSLAIAV